MLIAGEASGDLHASLLIKSLREIDSRAEFRFLGGDKMADVARCNPEVHYDKMNVMGFSAVLSHLPTLLKILSKAKKVLKEYRPDVLICVDYPSFNLRMASYARKLGIRVDWYISPKVWAWKSWRVRKIKKCVDNLYCILPFEPAFYQRRGYSGAKYVGNPSVQEIDEDLRHLPPLKYFIQRQDINCGEKPLIALLPGSRKSEIKNNLPLMLAAAKRFPDYCPVVAAAPAVPEKFYREVAQDPGLKLVFGSTVTLLKYSRAALVTSGTATLETALVGTPQVVCYRANGSKISYSIMEKLLNVKYVSLPNLIVGNEIVPELLLHFCDVESISRELAPLLQNSPRREWELGGYRIMRRKLGTYVASEYAAELIFESLLRQKRERREQRNAERRKSGYQRRGNATPNNRRRRYNPNQQNPNQQKSNQQKENSGVRNNNIASPSAGAKKEYDNQRNSTSNRPRNNRKVNSQSPDNNEHSVSKSRRKRSYSKGRGRSSQSAD